QLHGRLALPQSPCQVQPTPAKNLVRVDAMRSRYPRHRRAFHQRLFDNPPLLRDTPPLPRGRTQRLTLIRYDSCNFPGSVHLRSTWTPNLSVHFGRMALTYTNVQTAITGRLRLISCSSAFRVSMIQSNLGASPNIM